jgi:hypothetical protein
VATPGLVFDAREHFSGPQESADPKLTPWEAYAQALLLSNELFFAD